MAWVLEESQAEMADRLVLLAIANHCNAHWQCFPSVEKVAAEAKVSRRTVFRSIDTLVLLGELTVARARGRGNTNVYTVNPSQKRCQPDTFYAPEKVSARQEKVSIAPVKGVTGGTQTVSNRHEPACARPPLSPSAAREAARTAREALAKAKSNTPLGKQARKAS